MRAMANLSRWVTDIQFLAERSVKTHMRHLVKLNASLEKDAHLSRLNEALLEKRLSELEGIGSTRGAAYGLTLARINELALLCAGTYADQCEVQGLGDLLLNPRRILVHIKGMPEYVVKERHTGLTEQFADVAGTTVGVVAWLRDETVLEIKEKALLPHLYDMLCDSRVVSHEYLDSVRIRSRKIVDLSGFLASGHFSNGLEFHQWFQHAGDADKKSVDSKFCRFDTRIFFELGNDFQKILRMKAVQRSFFGRMKTAPIIPQDGIVGFPLTHKAGL
jgi:hypothetical protein